MSQSESEVGKADFEFYSRFVKPLILTLNCTDDRILASAWFSKLRDESSGSEKLRTDYLKLLLFVLQRHRLVGPFLENPNVDEKLPEFENQDLASMARMIIEKEQEERKERYLKRIRGEMGDYPPFITDYSPNLKEYTAAQDIPNFGIHVYYAISKKPIMEWDKAENAVITKNVRQMEPQGHYSETSFAVFEPRPETPDDDEYPGVHKTDETPPSARKTKERKSPFHDIDRLVPPLGVLPGETGPEVPPDIVEELPPPSWGSNLIEVREPIEPEGPEDIEDDIKESPIVEQELEPTPEDPEIGELLETSFNMDEIMAEVDAFEEDLEVVPEEGIEIDPAILEEERQFAEMQKMMDAHDAALAALIGDLDEDERRMLEEMEAEDAAKKAPKKKPPSPKKEVKVVADEDTVIKVLVDESKTREEERRIEVVKEEEKKTKPPGRTGLKMEKAKVTVLKPSEKKALEAEDEKAQVVATKSNLPQPGRRQIPLPSGSASTSRLRTPRKIPEPRAGASRMEIMNTTLEHQQEEVKEMFPEQDVSISEPQPQPQMRPRLQPQPRSQPRKSVAPMKKKPRAEFRRHELSPIEEASLELSNRKRSLRSPAADDLAIDLMEMEMLGKLGMDYYQIQPPQGRPPSSPELDAFAINEAEVGAVPPGAIPYIPYIPGSPTLDEFEAMEKEAGAVPPGARPYVRRASRDQQIGEFAETERRTAAAQAERARARRELSPESVEHLALEHMLDMYEGKPDPLLSPPKYSRHWGLRRLAQKYDYVPSGMQRKERFRAPTRGPEVDEFAAYEKLIDHYESRKGEVDQSPPQLSSHPEIRRLARSVKFERGQLGERTKEAVRTPPLFSKDAAVQGMGMKLKYDPAEFGVGPDEEFVWGPAFFGPYDVDKSPYEDDRDRRMKQRARAAAIARGEIVEPSPQPTPEPVLPEPPPPVEEPKSPPYTTIEELKEIAERADRQIETSPAIKSGLGATTPKTPPSPKRLRRNLFEAESPPPYESPPPSPPAMSTPPFVRVQSYGFPEIVTHEKLEQMKEVRDRARFHEELLQAELEDERVEILQTFPRLRRGRIEADGQQKEFRAGLSQGELDEYFEVLDFEEMERKALQEEQEAAALAAGFPRPRPPRRKFHPSSYRTPFLKYKPKIEPPSVGKPPGGTPDEPPPRQRTRLVYEGQVWELPKFSRAEIPPFKPFDQEVLAYQLPPDLVASDDLEEVEEVPGSPQFELKEWRTHAEVMAERLPMDIGIDIPDEMAPELVSFEDEEEKFMRMTETDEGKLEYLKYVVDKAAGEGQEENIEFEGPPELSSPYRTPERPPRPPSLQPPSPMWQFIPEESMLQEEQLPYLASPGTPPRVPPLVPSPPTSPTVPEFPEVQTPERFITDEELDFLASPGLDATPVPRTPPSPKTPTRYIMDEEPYWLASPGLPSPLDTLGKGFSPPLEAGLWGSPLTDQAFFDQESPGFLASPGFQPPTPTPPRAPPRSRLLFDTPPPHPDETFFESETIDEDLLASPGMPTELPVRIASPESPPPDLDAIKAELQRRKKYRYRTNRGFFKAGLKNVPRHSIRNYQIDPVHEDYESAVSIKTAPSVLMRYKNLMTKLPPLPPPGPLPSELMGEPHPRGYYYEESLLDRPISPERQLPEPIAPEWEVPGYRTPPHLKTKTFEEVMRRKHTPKEVSDQEYYHRAMPTRDVLLFEQPPEELVADEIAEAIVPTRLIFAEDLVSPPRPFPLWPPPPPPRQMQPAPLPSYATPPQPPRQPSPPQAPRQPTPVQLIQQPSPSQRAPPPPPPSRPHWSPLPGPSHVAHVFPYAPPLSPTPPRAPASAVMQALEVEEEPDPSRVKRRMQEISFTTEEFDPESPTEARKVVKGRTVLQFNRGQEGMQQEPVITPPTRGVAVYGQGPPQSFADLPEMGPPISPEHQARFDRLADRAAARRRYGQVSGGTPRSSRTARMLPRRTLFATEGVKLGRQRGELLGLEIIEDFEERQNEFIPEHLRGFQWMNYRWPEDHFYEKFREQFEYK